MLYLLQVAQQAILAKTNLPHTVKYVIWDSSFSRVVCMDKSNLTVMTRRLKPVTTITESNRGVKSAVFDDKLNLLYFNTLCHLKCCNLFNGEVITIVTLPCVVYLVKALTDVGLLACSRNGVVKIIPFKQK
uniref:Putative coatomer subunit alpha n=1 Tax=Lygus hesperus TaxID=30085 RepID=A0A0A9ZAA0_LYGHE